MTNRRNRSPMHAPFRVFIQLIVEAQRAEWRHNLVVVLVIAGLFSTPLVLGSIRYRFYDALKAQLEKESNARELRLVLQSVGGPPLDEQRVRELAARWPELEVVGNHKLLVSVEGPDSSDSLALQTLTPNDPRSAALGIEPPLHRRLRSTDLVVSDKLGQVLYGMSWARLWDRRSGRFRGAPLRLKINDLPLEPKFRVVARCTLPSRAIYGNDQLGTELRRYTPGVGSKTLALSSKDAPTLPDQLTEPLQFATDYDEILVYAPRIEEVEPLRALLAKHFPDYAVYYNVAAIAKLRRQDSRLTTLFCLTLGLSGLFLLSVLSALARVRHERRDRHAVLIGFSRPSVRRLDLAEHILLTLVSCTASSLVTTLLCSLTRSLLASGDAVGANADFALLLNSMRFDPRASVLVTALVAVCTWATHPGVGPKRG